MPTRNQYSKYVTFGVVGVLLLSVNAYAKAYAVSSQEFVRKASIANEFEIEASRLALEKSANDNVKDFAETMIDDHSKSDEKLQEVLKSTRAEVTPASELDAAHKKLLDNLNAASGEKFDSQYIAIQTDAHKQAVSLFSNYSKDGKDQALKNFATETLPALKEHLKHVQHLKTNL